MQNLSKFYKKIKMLSEGKCELDDVLEIGYQLEEHEIPIAQKQLNKLLKQLKK